MTKLERAWRLEAGEDVAEHVAIAVDRSKEKVKKRGNRSLSANLSEMGSGRNRLS